MTPLNGRNPYRLHSLMAGVLYVLGTAAGVSSVIVGGELLNAIVTGDPIAGDEVLILAAAASSQLTAGAFLTLVMGLSLSAMSVFLYPVFRKDSEALATGLLLFRGALEGTAYIFATFNILAFVALANQYVSAGADSAALQSMGDVMYQYFELFAPILSITFLIGATCLYVSFYRTKLIPRWLAVWGLIGVVPYFAYAIMQFFHIETGIGVYLQIPLGVQEMIMGVWLIVAGFSQAAVEQLDDTQVNQHQTFNNRAVRQPLAQNG